MKNAECRMQNAGALRTARPTLAFTLMEMLVVIAIIGILAGLVLYLGPAVSDMRKRKLVHAQMEALTMVIENYKENKGFYPPDNTNNPSINSLYYELTAQPFPPGVQADTVFGVGGVLNSSGTSTDSKNFFPTIKDSYWREIDVAGGKARIMGVQVSPPPNGPFKDFCFWNYRVAPQSPDPTIHNPQGFDLWVIVEMNKGPTTFSNWKEKE